MHTFTLFTAIFSSLVAANTYNMYAGFFSGSTLVRLEFDDATSTLTLAENITAPYTSGQKWIALDVSRSLYRLIMLRKKKANISYFLNTAPEEKSLCGHDWWLPKLHYRV